MTLAIITAEQRLSEATVKGCIFGPAGVGKTTLLKTLDSTTTLAISAEGGLLSVQRDDEFGPRFMGDTIEPSNWLELEAILKGFQMNPRPPGLAKYKTVFIDSISAASEWCFAWCQTQPDAFSEKKTLADGTPKPDTLGAYGLLGRTMSTWAWGWKNVAGVNVWLVGGLTTRENKATKMAEWAPLVMGAVLQDKLPYIMDYVVIMDRFKAAQADGTTATFTGFFTDPRGEYGTVPVKVRGGGFDPIEQPHLGKFMTKALGHRQPTSAPPSVAA